MSHDLLSAAVVIGALRVNLKHEMYFWGVTFEK